MFVHPDPSTKMAPDTAPEAPSLVVIWVPQNSAGQFQNASMCIFHVQFSTFSDLLCPSLIFPAVSNKKKTGAKLRRAHWSLPSGLQICGDLVKLRGPQKSGWFKLGEICSRLF